MLNIEIALSEYFNDVTNVKKYERESKVFKNGLQVLEADIGKYWHITTNQEISTKRPSTIFVILDHRYQNIHESFTIDNSPPTIAKHMKQYMKNRQNPSNPIIGELE